MVDDYLDTFLTLVSDTRYTDPQTLVVKFRRGLKTSIQSQIATMPFGQPADTDPEAWYAAARRIDQVWLTNEAFQSMLRLTMTAPAHFALSQSASLSTFCLPPSTPPSVPLRPTPPIPSGGIPIDVDAGNFIDKDFVCMKGISTWNISHPIPVFNMDGSSNEAGQISEVVDVVLRYKTHSERMLLAVYNLGKQSMILSYTWLKDHNPEVNWQTREVQMNQCPPQCEGCHAIRKEQALQKKVEAKAVNIC